MEAGPGRFARKRHAMVFQHPVMLRRSAHANVVHALGINGRAQARAPCARAMRRWSVSA